MDRCRRGAGGFLVTTRSRGRRGAVARGELFSDMLLRRGGEPWLGGSVGKGAELGNQSITGTAPVRLVAAHGAACQGVDLCWIRRRRRRIPAYMDSGDLRPVVASLPIIVAWL